MTERTILDYNKKHYLNLTNLDDKDYIDLKLKIKKLKFQQKIMIGLYGIVTVKNNLKNQQLLILLKMQKNIFHSRCILWFFEKTIHKINF